MLLERYAAQVSGMAFRFFRNEDDVKDFTSELFLKLCEKLKSVKVNDREEFGSWMVSFVRHAIIDQMRRQNTYTKHLEKQALNAVLYEEQSHQFDPDQLSMALEQLPENERLCVKEIYLEETSYQDLMEKHGFTFNQVRGYRDRGIRRLRQLMSDPGKGNSAKNERS